MCKMVHNGIEYGVMQLIAEVYDLLKRGLGFKNKEIHSVFREWNETELRGYLIEITGDIFTRRDEETGQFLLDVIRDEARQKGTGMWTTQDALALQCPTPTIDAAVTARDLSGLTALRRQVANDHPATYAPFSGNPAAWIAHLRKALYAAMIVTYSQGLSLLRSAADKYEYNLNLADVARIWRGGCIIRAALLEDIRSAYSATPTLATLLLDQHFAHEVATRQAALREIICEAAQAGIPTPGLMASLAYVDGLYSERLPANLIQAQRDYFGAHTYERIDREGTFHTQWRQS